MIYLGGGFVDGRGEGRVDWMRGVRGEGMGIRRRDGWKGGCCGWWLVVSGYGFQFRMVVLVVGLLNP